MSLVLSVLSNAIISKDVVSKVIKSIFVVIKLECLATTSNLYPSLIILIKVKPTV